MDQVAAVHGRPGHAILFETATGRMRQVPASASIGLWDTGVRHRLTGGSLDARRAECEYALGQLQRTWPELAQLADLEPGRLNQALRLLPAGVGRRVRHVVRETARTRQAAKLLAQRRWRALGTLLLAGHRSLRLDYQSSCVEADALVKRAVKEGAVGARLTGAGWGGVVLVLEGGTSRNRTRFTWKAPP
jgi:galactokinase